MSDDPIPPLEENGVRLKEIIDGSLVRYKCLPIPSIIELTPSNICNLKCAVCPKSHEGYPNEPLFMDSSVVEKVCEYITRVGFKGLVTLGGYGEPMMNDKLPLIVYRLSQVAKVDVITNGTLLNKHNLAALMTSGVNKLLVSVYSDQIMEEVTKLFDTVPQERYLIRDRREGCASLTNRAGAMRNGFSLNPCNYLLYTLMIDWNGDIMLCPQDFNRRVRFGNIMFEDIHDIWASSTMMNFRKSLMDTRIHRTPCRYCDVDGRMQGALHKEEWAKCLC